MSETDASQQWIGSSPRRKEDPSLLRGSATFVGDIQRPMMLHAAFLRSPFAHALLKSVDSSEAEAADGVVAVLTSSDLPSSPLPPFLWDSIPDVIRRQVAEVRHCDQHLLAVKKVRHVGEAVAVVIAESRYLAEDAVELVKVDYEELPAAASMETALEKGASRVHEEWESNVAADLKVSKGDVQSAFASAHLVVEDTFFIQRQGGLPMETRGTVAEYDEAQAQLTVWSSTQNVHRLQKALGNVLQLETAAIRVMAPSVGGGFGTKGVLYPEEPVVAFAAMNLGRPVKWVEDRIEHMQSAIHAREQKHHIQLAVDPEGRIVGLRDDFLVDNGAYLHIGIAIPYNTIAHLMGVYRVPHFEARARSVMTTRMATAPYRGAGRPEAVFALERIIDRAARALGMDPLELRKRNILSREDMPYEAGIRYRTGEPIVVDGGDFGEMLQTASDHVDDFIQRRAKEVIENSRKAVGVGFAGYIEGTGVGPFEGAKVSVDQSGLVQVVTGACSQGQAHETVFAQVCADYLGIDPQAVSVVGGDTRGIEFGWGTIASRSAVVAGSSVAQAAADVRRQAFDLAATLLEVSPEDLVMESGRIFPQGTPSRGLNLGELARAADPGSHRKPGAALGLTATAYFEPPSVTWAGGVHAAVVEVDLDLNTVSVLKYVVIHDCGRALNPQVVEGQVTGGVAQGLGGALLEEIIYDENGQIKTVTLADYMIPTMENIPPIVIEEMDSLSERNPLGLKGVGEGGTVPVAAAIANALEDALHDEGVIVRRTPLSPSFIQSLR